MHRFTRQKLMTILAVGICLNSAGAAMPPETDALVPNAGALHERIAEELESIEQTARRHGGWTRWLQKTDALRSTFESMLQSDREIVRSGDFFHLPNGYVYPVSWTRDYLAPEYFEAGKIGRSAVESIKTTRDWLASLGVHLMVVPIPPRMEVTPESLFGHHVDLPHRLHFIQTLLRAGVDAFDVFPALQAEQTRSGESLSLLRDSHYTSEGVSAVAQQLADALSRYGLSTAHSNNTPAFHAKRVSCQVRSSLAKYLAENDTLTLPPYETVEAISVLDGEGRPYQPEDETPFLVCGDSYTYIFAGVSGHLPAQLALEINESVSHVSMSGGGAAVPRLLARMGEERVKEFDVVVWAFTARYLTRSGWDKNPLSAPALNESHKLE